MNLVLLYSNDGMSFRNATPQNLDPKDVGKSGILPAGAPIVAAQGEVAFDHIPTDQELAAAFPGFLVAKTASTALAALSQKINNGIQIVSAGNLLINAIYAIDPQTINNIIALQLGIISGKDLPGGLKTVKHPDIVGVWHVFDEVTFTNFAVAVRDYVAAVEQAAAGQGVMPPNNIVNIP